MCLRPINIINPAKQIKLQGGQPFLMAVPCGQCAECSTARRNEYFMRSYYQAQETFSKGGYMLFDTLTYAPAHVPHISDTFPVFKDDTLDCMCFDRRHVRLFLVNLRTKLTRLGYDVKSGLKYFLSSEYGTTEGCTHRPHYHILFYVTIPELDPFELSQLISDCWSFGRTDGMPYQSAAYVNDKRVYRADNPFAVEKACQYVSKYVNKSSKFDKIIDRRVDCLYNKLMDSRSELLFTDDITLGTLDSCDLMNLLDGSIIDAKKRLRKEIVRCCGQFHRQSNYFGIYALECNSLNEIFDRGSIIYHSTSNAVVQVPIPTYFKRKLFYELVKDFRGHNVWELTPLGIQYKMSRLDNNITTLSDRFKDWLTDLSHKDDSDSVLQYHQIIKILGERSLDDFARYIALYKGRIAMPQCDFSVDNYMYRFFYDELFDKYYNYTSVRDSNYLNIQCLSPTYVGCSVDGYQDFDESQFKSNCIPLQQFIHSSVIDDTYNPAFVGFDQIYDLYVTTSLQSAVKIQRDYDELENRRERQKIFANNSPIHLDKELYSFIYS